ncbi:MAG: PQQ-binding-like beta-propeller repeat protein, partial [Verrucomicrobiota bacterium]|nr:PQQ-binding-like beta-propeller repeat protein [Verrucomicrobiota bacterium]
VQAGGKNYSVIAYEKESGKPLWHSLDDEAAYSSPMLVELAGERQLLIVTENRAVGVNPENGKLLWSFPWVVKLQNRNIAQPVLISTNRFFLSAGYGTGCAAIEISKTGDSFVARAVWQNKNLKNKFTSSVFFDGFLYGLDEDILVCLDAKTGERKWKDGRYGYGQILLASGHLVILSGEGQLVLVKATPEKHIEVARFQAIRGKTWNHPAISDGKIFVRNAVEMACFEIGR